MVFFKIADSRETEVSLKGLMNCVPGNRLIMGFWVSFLVGREQVFPGLLLFVGEQEWRRVSLQACHSAHRNTYSVKALLLDSITIEKPNLLRKLLFSLLGEGKKPTLHMIFCSGRVSLVLDPVSR